MNCSWTVHECSWLFMNVHEHSWTFMNSPPPDNQCSRTVHEQKFMNLQLHELFINIHERSWTHHLQITMFKNSSWTKVHELTTSWIVIERSWIHHLQIIMFMNRKVHQLTSWIKLKIIKNSSWTKIKLWKKIVKKKILWK